MEFNRDRGRGQTPGSSVEIDERSEDEREKTEGAFGKAKASTRIVKSISPINLALERKFLLLIDDWRPYEAAQAAGVEVVNSLAYMVGLYEQRRITPERALHALAKMTRRGTLRPEWIQSALRVVAEIRRKGENR
jgi:hypothetical protein